MSARLLCILVATLTAASAHAQPAAATTASTWTFDADTADKPPAGFSFGLTGSGKPGRWVVRPESALEGNVRFHDVKDGKRHQLASLLDTDDKTFTAPGRVAVWTKADSVTSFDDLTGAPL